MRASRIPSGSPAASRSLCASTARSYPEAWVAFPEIMHQYPHRTELMRPTGRTSNASAMASTWSASSASRHRHGAPRGNALALGRTGTGYPSQADPHRAALATCRRASVDIVARASGDRAGRPRLEADRRGGGASRRHQQYRHRGGRARKRDRTAYTCSSSPARLPAGQPDLYKDAGWNAAKDFRCVGLAVWNQSVALVHPSMPVKTIGEFVELARKRPRGGGEFNFGNPGTGSSIETSAAQKLFQVAGIKLTNRSATRSQPQALIDLMTNLMHFEIVIA